MVDNQATCTWVSIEPEIEGFVYGKAPRRSYITVPPEVYATVFDPACQKTVAIKVMVNDELIHTIVVRPLARGGKRAEIHPLLRGEP